MSETEPSAQPTAVQSEVAETITSPEQAIEGENSDANTEEVLTEAELAQIEASTDIDALLDLSSEIGEDQRSVFIKCCRTVYEKDFQEKKPQKLEDVEKGFNYFTSHVDRLVAIRTLVASEILPQGTPVTAEKNKVLAAISSLISNEIPISELPANSTPEEIAAKAREFDPERVVELLNSLNIRFVDELPGDNFVSADSGGGAVLVWAESPTMRGLDFLSIGQEIQQANSETGDDDDSPQPGMEAKNNIIEWFKEQEITEEDLNFYKYFGKSSEGFAVACLYRDQKQNPKAGGASLTLTAEYKKLMTALENNEPFQPSETIQKAYRLELDKYRTKWTVIHNSGVDIDDIPLDNQAGGIPDSESGDGSSGADAESAQTMAGGNSLENKDKTGLVKGERAGGLKVEGPKNLKEAIFNIFVQADADFGTALNPVSGFVGQAA